MTCAGANPRGRVVLLNGSSSAGKTTLARALQRTWPRPLQHIALDQFRDGMAGRYRGMNSAPGEPGALGLNVVPAHTPAGVATELRFGDVGRRMLKAMRRAAAAFAATGVDVVLDDLLLEPCFLHDYLVVLATFPVTFVGVRCDLATVNRREAARPGRFPGTAAAHFARVHAGCVYDVEVDTATHRPRECAARVLAAAREPPQPTAFERMRMVRRRGAAGGAVGGSST